MQTLEEFSLVRNVITDRYEQGYLPYLACCVGDYVLGLAHGALHTFINTLQLAYDLKHKPMTTLGTACYHLVKASGLVGLLLTDFAPSEELACYDPFFNEYEVQVKTMLGKMVLSALDCHDPKAMGQAIGTLTADMVVQEALLNGARTFYKSMQETAALARECTIGPQLEQALADTFATTHAEEALAFSPASHEYPLKMEPPESTIPKIEKAPTSSPPSESLEPASPKSVTQKKALYIQHTPEEIEQFISEILEKYKNHTLRGIEKVSLEELKKHWNHVFSKKHINAGLLELGDTMTEIYEKLIDVIFKKDALLEISEGLNQFFVIIEGQEVQVRIFVKNRTVLSLDGYLTHGKKGRIFKNN